MKKAKNDSKTTIRIAIKPSIARKLPSLSAILDGWAMDAGFTLILSTPKEAELGIGYDGSDLDHWATTVEVPSRDGPFGWVNVMLNASFKKERTAAALAHLALAHMLLKKVRGK